VPSVTAPIGANAASAEPVPQRDARDGLSTSIETAALVSRGDTLFATGDIASAKLFDEHAANAGNAQAAIRLGETFDPTFLSRVQVKGVRGEPAVALKWYKRAQELGASDADILVMSLQRN
jgi:TPR repeat protein